MAKKKDTDSLANLTKEQRHEIEQCFVMFDKDGNGSISKQELANAWRVLGGNPTSGDIDIMLKSADDNDDGNIDKEEFIILMATYMKEDQTEEQELREAFALFDKDGSGFVDGDEIRGLLKSIGEELSQEEINKIMKKADINGDNMLDYNEFVKFMTRKVDLQRK